MFLFLRISWLGYSLIAIGFLIALRAVDQGTTAGYPQLLLLTLAFGGLITACIASRDASADDEDRTFGFFICACISGFIPALALWHALGFAVSANPLWLVVAGIFTVIGAILALLYAAPILIQQAWTSMFGKDTPGSA